MDFDQHTFLGRNVLEDIYNIQTIFRRDFSLKSTCCFRVWILESVTFTHKIIETKTRPWVEKIRYHYCKKFRGILQIGAVNISVFSKIPVPLIWCHVIGSSGRDVGPISRSLYFETRPSGEE